MQKPTFRNFHKQKYTLLSKNMQRKNTVDSNPITLRNLGKCQGKPQCGETQRERERERSYYYALGKYKTAANPHFQPRKIPHSTKSIPQKSASFFVPKPYYCTASSVPRFPCPQSDVQIVRYSPEITNRKQKSASKFMPEMPRFLCQVCTDYTDPYRTASHSRKIFLPKTHRKFFSGIMPYFLGKRALFVAHFPLSSMLRKSL
jgi:hypothetical protein